MKKHVTLICSECLARNYHKTESKTSSDRLQLKKYCPNCNKHTLHKESK